MGFIDAHVHVWTDDFVRYPLAPGEDPRDMALSRFSPEDILAAARPEGVDRVVLIQMSYYGAANRYMLDVIREAPATFRGVAILEASEDIPRRMRELKGQGVRGFRITPGHASTADWLGDETLRRMFDQAGAEGMAICPLIEPEALPGLDAMCELHPGTTVVIDHFARIGLRGPILEEQLDALCRLARHPHAHVKVSAFYALGGKRPPHTDLAPMVRRVRDAFGADRLMWASDCPFQTMHSTYHDSVALVRDRLEFLSAEERDAILRRTAERVFFG